MKKLTEFLWIDTCLKPLATSPAALHLQDDAAIFEGPEGYEWVVSTDTSVAGVHFLPSLPPQEIAVKIFRSSLSDLAAMGAQPVGYLMNFCRPSTGCPDEWLTAFAEALRDEQEKFECSLWGGDTVLSPESLQITFTVFGQTLKGKSLKRQGAQVGDLIFVTGFLGDSHLGLNVLSGVLQIPEPHASYLINRHLHPPTLWSFSCAAAKAGVVSSAIDISDGFLADLEHILKSSQVSAGVALENLPLSSAVQSCWHLLEKPFKTPWEAVLTGGEDYELIFTVPRGRVTEWLALASTHNVRLHQVGEIITLQDDNIALTLHGERHRISWEGYVHF